MRKIDKLLSQTLPYIIFILIAFNTVLSNQGIHYSYILILVFAILGMLFGKFKNLSKSIIVVYIYLFSLLTLLLIQLFIYDLEMSVVKSLLMYVFMLMYWIVYFQKYTQSDFISLINKIVPIVYLVGFLGVVQYFFSPTLYGLLNESTSKGIKWASSQSFTEYALFFRASSTLGSPQVYGLFIALFIVLIDSFKLNKNYIGIIFLMFTGLLSGNKSFLLIISIYYIYKFIVNMKYTKLRRVFLVLCSFFIITILVPVNTFDDVRVVNRLFDYEKISNQESEDSRIDRYITIVESTPIFVGSGFGTKTDRSDLSVKVAESYIFQILAETGIIILSFFLLLLLVSFLQGNKQIKIMISIMFLSMIIVHAFNSPVFYIFWGILIMPYANKFKRVA